VVFWDGDSMSVAAGITKQSEWHLGMTYNIGTGKAFSTWLAT